MHSAGGAVLLAVRLLDLAYEHAIDVVGRVGPGSRDPPQAGGAIDAGWQADHSPATPGECTACARRQEVILGAACLLAGSQAFCDIHMTPA